MERVILRREKNPYTKQMGYLAIFPDDEANPGCVGAISFYFNLFDEPIFEPYCEISLGYMYKKKIIHKNEDDVNRCLNALNNMYDTEFTVCEKMSNPRRKTNYRKGN